jgi:protein SCO1/2
MQDKVMASLLVLSLLLSGCLGTTEKIHKVEFNGITLIPAAAPDFSLTDQYNQSFNLSAEQGKIVVVAFIYTHCPDVCPAVEANLKNVKTELGPSYGSEVLFISISVDPARDTPQVLLNFTTQGGYDWPHLTGEHQLLQLLWYDWGIAVDESAIGSSHSEGDNESQHNSTDNANETEAGAAQAVQNVYEVGHSTVTYILDRNLDKRVAWVGYDWNTSEFLTDILTLLETTDNGIKRGG